jgi:CHC2 zinc finger
MSAEIESAKARLTIPDLWSKFNLPGKPSKQCRSPFREDKNPSFGIYAEGRKFKDLASGAHGDAIQFLAMIKGITNREAFPLFLEMAKGYSPSEEPASNSRQEKETQRPDLSRLRKGSPEELARIAESRGLDIRAVERAQELGTLRVGELFGLPSWVLTDASGICAEGRRINRQPYPENSKLPERKAHCLKWSKKSWPVGILPPAGKCEAFNVIALVEGGPDYLAALHFMLRQNRTDILPVAMLGGGVALQEDGLALFHGHRVRIYPHNDGGNGLRAARGWAEQLRLVGCKVDRFNFEGLLRADGEPVKDLNDAAQIAPGQAGELEELFL